MPSLPENIELKNKGKCISAGTVQKWDAFPVIFLPHYMMCQKCKFKQCLGVGSFWKWWGCMLAEASRPNGFEATRSNISLRKSGSQDNDWGDMCCFQSIKPKLSHRVIKLNSTDFCVIIVIIYHLNYWSTLRRQLKWEQRKLLLYEDVMGVWQSGWAHRLQRRGWNKMKRNGVAIRHWQCSSAGPEGKILHPDFRQAAQHLADSGLPPQLVATEGKAQAWHRSCAELHGAAGSGCHAAHQSLHLSRSSSDRSFFISLKSLATACFSQHPVLSAEKLTHPLACQLGSVQMRQESSPFPLPHCWAHTNCHL